MAFKLAFAWYLNALFNLNPFLALDGYYLLMDWLEVPNLRARGLAFVVATARRRAGRRAGRARSRGPARRALRHRSRCSGWSSPSTSPTGCTAIGSAEP